MTGLRLSARADDGATAVPALLAALERAGIGVHGVTAARPTLDDVYLRFTGRRLADAEEPATPASTAPASTAPASTAPASTAPASTAPASTAPASTAPEGSR